MEAGPATDVTVYMARLSDHTWYVVFTISTYWSLPTEPFVSGGNPPVGVESIPSKLKPVAAASGAVGASGPLLAGTICATGSGLFDLRMRQGGSSCSSRFTCAESGTASFASAPNGAQPSTS